LIVHAFGHHALLTVDGRPLATVDATTLLLIVGVVASLSLPSIRRFKLGEAEVEFDVERARALVGSAVGSEALNAKEDEDDSRPAPSDPLQVAASVFDDLTSVIRDLAISAGIDSAATKPASLLAKELADQGVLSPAQEAAVAGVLQPLQTELTVRAGMSSATALELRRLSFVLMEALQPPSSCQAIDQT
jgi:hypothetical protein